MRILATRLCAQSLVMACLLLAATSGAGAEKAANFRTYEDTAGFTCEFPAGWSFGQSVKGDRVFSAPAELTPDATIIVQVIDREKTAEKTAIAQLEALKAQLLQASEARLLTEGSAAIAGQQAPFLIASYKTTDTAGKLRTFRHIQSVVTAPRMFLLMSYSAPDEIFDDYMKVFQHASATLTLTAADVAVPGSEDVAVWRHNADRDFWIAAPAIWSNKIDPAEVYSLDMRHPDRVEGVIIWVLDMPKRMKVKDLADLWEKNLGDKVFFMKDRIAAPAIDHPGAGVDNVPVIVREYQGEVSGATVRSIAAYAVYKRRAFTVVGYHFLGDEKGAGRVRDAVLSFRLASPD